MFRDELRHRVRRIAGGDRRHDDIDRILLSLRDKSGDRESIRELGDFIAHREQREKGLLTTKARDVFLSFRSWINIRSGMPFTLADIRKVAEANLRTATDQQLSERIGLTRPIARSVLEQTLRKLEKGTAQKRPSKRERLVIDYLGGAFIWNSAFTDEVVVEDLIHVLELNNLIEPSEIPHFRAVKDFLTLHLLATMHGSAVILEDGTRVDLVAGYDNPERRLEIKADLRFTVISKPARMPFCLFWTSLSADNHCNQELMARGMPWTRPLECRDGRLSEIADQPKYQSASERSNGVTS